MTIARRRLWWGLIPIAITLASAALGRAYGAYLDATPFPPDRARLVPVACLITALVGLALSCRALLTRPRGSLATAALLLGAIGLLLALPNIGYAAVYTLAAAMGD